MSEPAALPGWERYTVLKAEAEYGGLGLWTLLDVFFVGRRVRAVNRSRRAAIMARRGIVEEPSR